MDGVAALTGEERAELFVETAVRLGIGRAAIVEKDFWVCWTLRRLFTLQRTYPDAYPALVFKGGTSLSKVFGLIRRFSEDIDLSIDWRGLGFSGDKDPATAGTKRRQQLLKALAPACEQYLASDLVPALTADFATVLGPGGAGAPWTLAVDAEEKQTVNFTYPPSLTDDTYAGFDYLRPVVRLEFGARGEQWPAGTHEVTPYAAQVFPDQFSTPSAQVQALEAERTFWEKATILHAWAHRGALPTSAERGSRHYYDLAMLARSAVRNRALAGIDLLARVAEHKRKFYSAAWARYELARPGSLRLMPDDAMLPALRADYAAMAEMIFDAPPPFDALLGEIYDLERDVNAAGATP